MQYLLINYNYNKKIDIDDRLNQTVNFNHLKVHYN